MDDTITAHEVLGMPDRRSGTFTFDQVSYDKTADVLILRSGPPCASVSERTPEGHLVRIDALDNRVVSIQIDGARERIRGTDEPLPVTVGPGQRLMLDPRDLRFLIASGRFSSRPDGQADVLTMAKAAAAKAAFAS